MDRSPLTEQSAAGRYFVVTQSRSIFEVILDPDLPPRITRYRVGDNIELLDGGPTSGVGRFWFDSRTGEGAVWWWKDRVENRDDPNALYAGSVRQTSRVRLVIRDDSGDDSIAPSTPPIQWSKELASRIREHGAGSVLDDLRLGLSRATDDEFEDFIAAEFGRQE